MSPYKDPVKQQEYYTQYRKDNKERIQFLWREWVRAHPERRRAIALASYHRRKEANQ